MKKFLVFAITFSLIAAAASAQVSFGGYFNSGVGIVADNVDGNDMHMTAFGVDSESAGYRLRLNGSYQNEARTSGFRIRLQSQRTLTPGGMATGSATAGGDAHTHPVNGVFLSLPFAYGFMNFFDNKVSVIGGIVDDSQWQTADWWINEDATEGLGVLFKFNNLIEGLGLRFRTYVTSIRGGGHNNILARK